MHHHITGLDNKYMFNLDNLEQRYCFQNTSVQNDEQYLQH